MPLPVSTDSASPWQPRSLRNPAWSPTKHADLHSTSTVTDSNTSPSASPCSSRDGSDTEFSPRSSPTPPALPPDEFDEDYELASPFSRKTISVASRALPRCAVVNFSKDGDNLRWSPRAAQNASGVAARVHNFEDAFSLEEFSSRALPVVWHPQGGNPRLSSALKEEHLKKTDKATTPRSKSSMSASEKSLMKSNSIKKTVVLAQDFRRPSFWNLLAHNNRIQKNKAQPLGSHRLEEEERAALGKKSAWSARIKAVMKRGGLEKRGGGKKNGSLFRRFVEKRNAKSEAKRAVPAKEEKAKDLVLPKVGPDREENPGSIRLRKRPNVNRASADVSKLSESGRRVRTTLGGGAKKKAERGVSRTSQDDQYVTFMTSALC